MNLLVEDQNAKIPNGRHWSWVPQQIHSICWREVGGDNKGIVECLCFSGVVSWSDAKTIYKTNVYKCICRYIYIYNYIYTVYEYSCRMTWNSNDHWFWVENTFLPAEKNRACFWFAPFGLWGVGGGAGQYSPALCTHAWCYATHATL